MYGFRTEATIWMDRSAYGDVRRYFVAKYVIDDGFESENACWTAVKALGFNPEEFAYILFHDMWYAISFDRYVKYVLITSVKSYRGAEIFSSGIDVTELKDTKPDTELILQPDDKSWKEGIQRDLLTYDGSARVFFKAEEYPQESVLANNVMILFGKNFFINEICIRTEAYTSHVFTNYFDRESLADINWQAKYFHDADYEYYNPFSGSKSHNEREKTKKERTLTKGVDMGDIIMRPWEEGNVKTMRKDEIYPTRVRLY